MSEWTDYGISDQLIAWAIGNGLAYDRANGRFYWPSGDELPQSQSSEGYFGVTLGPVGKRRRIHSARLVCWFVHGPPSAPKMVSDHINRIRSDDRPENLRWATFRENAMNVSDQGWANRIAAVKKNLKLKRGESTGNSIFKDSDIIAIREMHKNGKTYEEIASVYNCCNWNIGRIVRRERWKHI